MVKDFAISTLFKGSYYHLWYLLSLLYAVPVLCILISRLRHRQIIFVCISGWVLECAVNSYSWLFAAIPTHTLIPKMIGMFSAVVIALFRAVPLLYVGVCLSLEKETQNDRACGKMCAAALVLWCVEIITPSCLNGIDSAYAYVLSTPIVVYFMAKWLLRLKKPMMPVFLE